MKYVWLALIVSALWLVVLLLYSRYQNKRSQKLVSDLSDLIESILRLSDTPVFPEFDDSLTSKLQSQVSRLKQMLSDNERLQKQEKDEMKSLISDISHQLKTPVAILQTYGELMTDSVETQYTKEFLHALDRLRFLTDSLVKMSRLEGGVVTLQPKLCSLNETILSSIMQAYEKALKKNITIEFDNEPQLNLIHDPRWTMEAIFNILDNATKYSLPDSTVTLKLTKQEMYCRLDIINTGINIPESEYEKIFKRFYRCKTATSEEGYGLGLYLSRKIITSQRGYIKVSSKDKTIFSIYLPIPPSGLSNDN